MERISNRVHRYELLSLTTLRLNGITRRIHGLPYLIGSCSLCSFKNVHEREYFLQIIGQIRGGQRDSGGVVRRVRYAMLCHNTVRYGMT